MAVNKGNVDINSKSYKRTIYIDNHVEHPHYTLFEDSLERQIYLVYLNGIEMYTRNTYIVLIVEIVSE